MTDAKEDKAMEAALGAIERGDKEAFMAALNENPDDDTLKPYVTGSVRADRCVIACAGLDLPVDVPEGAVKRLVEAATRLLRDHSGIADNDMKYAEDDAAE